MSTQSQPIESTQLGEATVTNSPKILEKRLYTAAVTATSGRVGRVTSSDGTLDLAVNLPKAMGGSDAPGTTRSSSLPQAMPPVSAVAFRTLRLTRSSAPGPFRSRRTSRLARSVLASAWPSSSSRTFPSCRASKRKPCCARLTKYVPIRTPRAATSRWSCAWRSAPGKLAHPGARFFR